MSEFHKPTNSDSPSFKNYLHWLEERGLTWLTMIAQQPEVAPENTRASCPQCQKSYIDLMSHFSGYNKPRLVCFYSNRLNDDLDLASSSSSRDSSSLTLLKKMIKAMKVSLTDTLLVDHEQSDCLSCWQAMVEFVQPSCVLIFGEDALEKLTINLQTPASYGGVSITHLGWDIPTIATHDPEELLDNPNLKRTTWQHLQTAMTFLNPPTTTGVGE